MQVVLLSGSALVTQTRCFAVTILGLQVTRLLAGCHLNEGARYPSARQAITSARQAIVPARYDEGALAANHNAATGERGYRITYVSKKM